MTATGWMTVVGSLLLACSAGCHEPTSDLALLADVGDAPDVTAELDGSEDDGVDGTTDGVSDAADIAEDTTSDAISDVAPEIGLDGTPDAPADSATDTGSDDGPADALPDGEPAPDADVADLPDDATEVGPGPCASDDSPCDDGNPCTEGDACNSGNCAPTGVLSCDDANPCTADDCDPTNGCAHFTRLFSRAYGGDQEDLALAMMPNASGFALAGSTKSVGAGKRDFWLIQTDGGGDVLWSRTYGTSGDEKLGAALMLSDGFALAGSSTGKGADAWLVRTDLQGELKWELSLGGSWNDYVTALAAVPGGLVLARHSFLDVWLAQIDGGGKVAWTKQYGGAGSSSNYHRIWALAADASGIAVAGESVTVTQSQDLKTDAWLVRTDAAGNVKWDRTYGGEGLQWANDVAILSDGLLLAGTTSSSMLGNADFWLVRVDGAGNELWNRAYGGQEYEVACAVGILADGFLIAGSRATYPVDGPDTEDAWLVRTDLAGNQLWAKTIGGPGNDSAYRLAVLPDGFALAGYTTSKGSGLEDVWLVRTDIWGHSNCLEAGACAGTPVTLCDDLNPCTADYCAGALGCTHSNLPDGTACGPSHLCKTGQCAL
jgi:hypothetical protein